MKVIIEKCEELINSNNLPAGAEQSRERENKKVEKRQASEMIKQLPDITPKIGGIVEYDESDDNNNSNNNNNSNQPSNNQANSRPTNKEISEAARNFTNEVFGDILEGFTGVKIPKDSELPQQFRDNDKLDILYMVEYIEKHASPEIKKMLERDGDRNSIKAIYQKLMETDTDEIAKE